MRLRVLQLRETITEILKMPHVDDPDRFFPNDHRFAMEVTKGGSCCANCRWVNETGDRCGNDLFRAWQKDVEGKEGDGRLPLPADRYCCDLWGPKKGS